MARWVSFLNRVSHNEVGSNQNNVPANKSSLLLLLLVHSIHFQVFDKKFILELFPRLQSWSFQGWTKNWFDNNFNLWYVRRMDLVRFSRLERSDMAASVAESFAEEHWTEVHDLALKRSLWRYSRCMGGTHSHGMPVAGGYNKDFCLLGPIRVS